MVCIHWNNGPNILIHTHLFFRPGSSLDLGLDSTMSKQAKFNLNCQPLIQIASRNLTWISRNSISWVLKKSCTVLAGCVAAMAECDSKTQSAWEKTGIIEDLSDDFFVFTWIGMILEKEELYCSNLYYLDTLVNMFWGLKHNKE